MRGDKVLLTVDRDHPLWLAARADVQSAYLPYTLREIIAGNVEEVTVPATEWAKLQTYCASLPGGAAALPFAVSDAPPPEPQETSERAVVARKLGDIVRALGAVSPFGGDVTREEAGRYYQVCFSQGRNMQGAVFVYSVGYIRIAYTAYTKNPPPDGLPVQDTRVYDSPEAAAKFLSLTLHGAKYAEALAIPQRQRKRAKPS